MPDQHQPSSKFLFRFFSGAVCVLLAVAGLLGIASSSAAAAADQPGASATNADTPATGDVPPSADEPSGDGAGKPDDAPAPPAPPSLDDLLGIPAEEKDANAQDAATQDQSEELERKLNEVELADAFQVAIAKMSLSAELLEKKFDPGLGTQRVQEDIIAKLAQLLDQARRQQGKSSSSSSSSSSQQQQQQKDASNQNQQGKQQSKAQDQQNGNQRNQNATNSQEGDPPPFQEGDINQVMEETRTEWGGLPQRVRDMLLQGRKERPSRLYEQLTSEYYKRLAEENSP
jgi:hypothetical protein